MGRLFTRLFNKNSLKAFSERPKVPFRNEAEPSHRNHYKIVGIFWSVGIPTTLVLFYFLQKQIESEKRFFYKQIRDELRAQKE